MEKRRIAIIVFGIFLATAISAIGLFQINEMMMVIAGYDTLQEWIWIPGLGANALLCFEVFWLMAFSGIPITLITWYLARKYG